MSALAEYLIDHIKNLLTELSSENFFSSFMFNFMASVIEGIFETLCSISRNHRLSRRGSVDEDPCDRDVSKWI